MGLQLLAHGSQDGLVKLVDVVVEDVDGVVALLLARALVLDGEDQVLDGVRHGLGVGGQELPHGWVVGVHGQVLGRQQQAVAGLVDALASMQDGLLGPATLGADFGWGGGKLGAGGEGGQSFHGLDERLGGLCTCLAVLCTQVTGKSLNKSSMRLIMIALSHHIGH